MVYKMKLAEITEIRLDEDFSGPKELAFSKLHGNGNDFVLVDEHARELVPETLKSSFAMHYCNRNFGIGGDGIIFFSDSIHADVKMRLFQPDGSEAEMCGNGIRCLAKYAWDDGYVDRCFEVETLAEIVPVKVRDIEGNFWARVDMGVPSFDREGIPALGKGEFLVENMEGYEVSAVNTGVPHAVIFVEDLDLPIADIAPLIRHSSIFPQGANVNFVKVAGSLEIRTFERGVEAETLSCGTGAVASAAVARRRGLVEDEVFVDTLGGPLIVSFQEERTYLDGPAVSVYSGKLSEGIRWDLWKDL